MTTKRGSSSIGPKQAARAFHAARFATSINRPFNLLVTIDTSSLSIADTDAGTFLREVWARFTRWWAYQRDKKQRNIGAFGAVMVHENPSSGPRHAHWHMHIPDEIRDEVEEIIRNRIEKLTDLNCLGKAIHFLSTPSPGGVMKYIMKGIDPRYANHFHMNAEDQGEIVGRRMTVSRSVGYTARKNAGWTRSRPHPSSGAGVTRGKRPQGPNHPKSLIIPFSTPVPRALTAETGRSRDRLAKRSKSREPPPIR